MNNRGPRGYIDITDACSEAMKIWYPAEAAEWERRIRVVESRAKTDIAADETRAPLITRALNKLREDITLEYFRPSWDKAVLYFGDALLNGDIVACYFSQNEQCSGTTTISRSELANIDLDNLIRRGLYTNYKFNIYSARLLIENHALHRFLAPTCQEFRPNRARGRPSVGREAVKVKMRTWEPKKLADLKGIAMANLFGASRKTCTRARSEVLSEWSEIDPGNKNQ